MAHLSHVYMTKAIACYKNKLEVFLYSEVGLTPRTCLWHSPAVVSRRRPCCWQGGHRFRDGESSFTVKVTGVTLVQKQQKVPAPSGVCVWLEHWMHVFPRAHWMLCGGWISSICSLNSVLWSSFSILLFSAPILNHFISFSCLGIFTLKLWEKAMAPHSSTVAWKIPTEEPGRLHGFLRRRAV